VTADRVQEFTHFGTQGVFVVTLNFLHRQVIFVAFGTMMNEQMLGMQIKGDVGTVLKQMQYSLVINSRRPFDIVWAEVNHCTQLATRKGRVFFGMKGAVVAHTCPKTLKTRGAQSG